MRRTLYPAFHTCSNTKSALYSLSEVLPKNPIKKTYLWGLDLSGSPAWKGGAAGVGGLVTIGYGTDGYYPAYDGNGDVMGLIGSADGKIAAQYENGPFGEAIRASG